MDNYETKFLEKIKSFTVVNESGCWNREGRENRVPEVCFRKANRRCHRIVYELTNQVILTKKDYVVRSCNNNGCYNPAHITITSKKPMEGGKKPVRDQDGREFPSLMDAATANGLCLSRASTLANKRIEIEGFSLDFI